MSNTDEEMYDYLEEEKLLPEKKRDTDDEVLEFIDKTVLKDCKKRHTNLSMAWIDYK